MEKICKSVAKADYFLTDKDLAPLVYTSVPRRGRFHDYVLYNLSDIVTVFCDKYHISNTDIVAKQTELAEQKKLAKEKRAIKSKTKEIYRKKELEEALAKYKLTLRDDSSLCQGYIDGSIRDWTLDKIVNRMCQMKYLFDYCNMDSCLEQAYQEQRDERRAGYYPDMSVFEQAELIALRHKSYPDTWPWME